MPITESELEELAQHEIDKVDSFAKDASEYFSKCGDIEETKSYLRSKKCGWATSDELYGESLWVQIAIHPLVGYHQKLEVIKKIGKILHDKSKEVHEKNGITYYVVDDKVYKMYQIRKKEPWALAKKFD